MGPVVGLWTVELLVGVENLSERGCVTAVIGLAQNCVCVCVCVLDI